MSRKSLLVTGTDTGVGKTVVACAIARALARHMSVAPLNPVETGCATENGELVPADAVALHAAAGGRLPLDLVCPYRFAEPLAPAVAAERAGRAIDPAHLREVFEELSRRADVVLVESAGGLLVPISGRWSFADLATDLGLPMLLVVGTRLGALNQTLLTLECAARRGIEVVGYVLNQITPEADLAQATNASALRRLTDVPSLGEIGWLGSDPTSDDRIAEAIVARLWPVPSPRGGE